MEHLPDMGMSIPSIMGQIVHEMSPESWSKLGPKREGIVN